MMYPLRTRDPYEKESPGNQHAVTLAKIRGQEQRSECQTPVGDSFVVEMIEQEKGQ